MPELTKEQLGEIIKEETIDAIKSSSEIITDMVEGMIDEKVQEAIKDVGVKSPEFEDVHPELDPKGGFENIGTFAQAVYAAGKHPVMSTILNNTDPKVKKLGEWLVLSDKILAEEKAAGTPSQNTTSLEAGAALIPPEFSRTALVRSEERIGIVNDAMVIPMSAMQISIPFIDDFNRSQGLIAGNLKFRWTDEEAQLTANQVKFKMRQLNLNKATALVFVSEDLMDISPVSILPIITRAIDTGLDDALLEAYLFGTGAGQPQGYLNADCLVTIPAEGEQVAKTFVYENMLNMYARSVGPKVKWYHNRTMTTQFGLMKLDIGTGGSAVFMSASNVAGAPLQFMNGVPLVESEQMKTLGTVGDIALLDWSQYLIGQLTGNTGLQTSESAHLKFDFDQHAFKFKFWTDGRAWWPQAYTPKNGDSRSPAVTLAAR